MSALGRTLQVGDLASTMYSGRFDLVVISARRDGVSPSQSGIQFQVEPPLRRWRDASNPYDEFPAWYDADWFDPVVVQPELPGGGAG